MFPIHKWGYFSKVKEIKRLRGGVACYAAQATAPIDAEIGKIDHLWMETSSFSWYILQSIESINNSSSVVSVSNTDLQLTVIIQIAISEKHIKYFLV